MCGLRPAELLGLRWEDVDTAEGVIRVRKSVKFTETPDGKRLPTIEVLKTDRSKRTLVMHVAVSRMLAALRRDQAALRLRAGSGYTDHGLVFPGGDGRPCWPGTARGRFRALCKRAR